MLKQVEEARCWCRRDSNVIELRIRVIPRGHQTAWGSARGDRLVIRINSPPTFGRRQRDVELVNGEHNQDKVIRIHGARMIPATLS